MMTPLLRSGIGDAVASKHADPFRINFVQPWKPPSPMVMNTCARPGLQTD